MATPRALPDSEVYTLDLLGWPSEVVSPEVSSHRSDSLHQLNEPPDFSKLRFLQNENLRDGKN